MTTLDWVQLVVGALTVAALLTGAVCCFVHAAELAHQNRTATKPTEEHQ